MKNRKGRRPPNKGSSSVNGKWSIVDNPETLPKNLRRRMTQKRVTGAGIDVRLGMPTFYQPLFQATNMLLPRDRRERNEWCRHFYRTEPIIATAMDIHSEFPISGINNMCSDPHIKRFFDYMAFDKLDMVNLLLDIGLEYWKIGDVFPFGQFNEATGMWEQFTLLNPDYVNLKSSLFADEPVIELIPDSTLTAVAASGPTGEYGDLYRQFPEDVINQVRLGKNIVLDSRLVTHIAHKAAPYETWGTPLMMRCFKTLIYKDKLRQAQDAIANRHIMPLRVAKIGTPGEPMPTQEDIDSFRDLLYAGDGDPNYFLVYHYGLSFDYVGSTGKILPLNTEFAFIDSELLTGMCITKEMLSGNGASFAVGSGGVSQDALAHRYMSYRLRLESFIRNKIYRPVSEVQQFYKPYTEDGFQTKFMTSAALKRAAANKELELIVPKIVWSHQDLTTNQSVMLFIQNLQAKNLVSMTTILPLLSLDPETEKRNLERERGTVFDPNAPKTGPLPNEGHPLNYVNDGVTVREVRTDEHGEPIVEEQQQPVERPLQPSKGNSKEEGEPSTGNNPADFGFPGEASTSNPRALRRLALAKESFTREPEGVSVGD